MTAAEFMKYCIEQQIASKEIILLYIECSGNIYFIEDDFVNLKYFNEQFKNREVKHYEH